MRTLPSAPGSLARARRGNGATVVQGPLAAGVPDEAPFDAILLNGAVPEVPQALLDQLKDGGRLVAIVAPERLWAGAGVAPYGALVRQFDRVRCGRRCAAGVCPRTRIRVLSAALSFTRPC